jgi:hypothetical protein
MKRKLPIKDCHGQIIYEGDLVEIDGKIHKASFFSKHDFWFYKDGAGWIYDFGKYKIKKI